MFVTHVKAKFGLRSFPVQELDVRCNMLCAVKSLSLFLCKAVESDTCKKKFPSTI